MFDPGGNKMQYTGAAFWERQQGCKPRDPQAIPQRSFREIHLDFKITREGNHFIVKIFKLS